MDWAVPFRCVTSHLSPYRFVIPVDYDVHHGNGTQAAFYNDKNTLFISLHQDNNYPQGEGSVAQIGEGEGRGYNINIPLPPVSSSLLPRW